MLTASMDLLNEDWPGYDVTWFYEGAWGVRYSYMNDLTFLENEVYADSQQVSHYTVKGDYQSPFLLFTADYKSNRPGTSPFEWLTGYYGVGHSTFTVKVHENRFTDSAGSIVHNDYVESHKMEQSSLVFGFTGQEKYLALDVRFWGYQAKIPAEGALKTNIAFRNWGLLLSIGLGF